MPGKLSSKRRPWEPEVNTAKQSGRFNDNHDFYNSTAWKRDRKAHLAANPLCVKCKKEGRTVLANVSDHKTPINQGGDPWRWENRQALCSSCHNSKSGKERHGK